MNFVLVSPTLPISIPDDERKSTEIFIFTLFCGASKGFVWCLKRFYEGLKNLHKTFWGTTKKRENKNLRRFLF